MCRVLGVSKSGFYARRGAAESPRARRNRELAGLIKAIHSASRQTYGAPRIHQELRLGQGVRCSKKRVAAIMAAHSLAGVTRRRRWSTTRPNPGAIPAPDLVARSFTATEPNRLWVADITFVPTRQGFVFLAVVLDVFSRRIVGWAVRRRQQEELVVAALDMAIAQRRPGPGLVHHSDRGVQYTARSLRARAAKIGMQLSMGRTGDPYDNAVVESFFATLECEFLGRAGFADKRDAEVELFSYIEGFYNLRRRHSSLGYLSPAVYEKSHLLQTMNQSPAVH
jgi:putative transposase